MKYLIKTKVWLKNDILDSVNETMQGFGFDEKARLIHTRNLILTVERELTEEEKSKIIEVMQNEFKESEAFHSLEVLSFEKYK
jgi:hypothetical protein